MKTAAAILAIGTAAATAAGCSSPRAAERAPAPVVTVTPGRAPAPVVLGGTPADMPRAVVYRMSGDYSRNVPVTLGADDGIASYPAPSDLSESSLPVDMGDGLWLDRRGMGLRSVFTSYTYSQYMSLPQAPSPQQLRDAIIPGARVINVYPLPMAIGADSTEVAEYISTHPELFLK